MWWCAVVAHVEDWTSAPNIHNTDRSTVVNRCQCVAFSAPVLSRFRSYLWFYFHFLIWCTRTFLVPDWGYCLKVNRTSTSKCELVCWSEKMPKRNETGYRNILFMWSARNWGWTQGVDMKSAVLTKMWLVPWLTQFSMVHSTHLSSFALMRICRFL